MLAVAGSLWLLTWIRQRVIHRCILPPPGHSGTLYEYSVAYFVPNSTRTHTHLRAPGAPCAVSLLPSRAPQADVPGMSEHDVMVEVDTHSLVVEGTHVDRWALGRIRGVC